MVITVAPYHDDTAWLVLRQLDAADVLEAELMRGTGAQALALFADWRAMQGYRIASHVALTGAAPGRTPFAVFGLVNTGQAGVAAAALLARDHRRHRRDLAQLARAIRDALPRFAAETGLHRIEARCWADHPTAASLLTALGFHRECDMPGFGLRGDVTFAQFAWLAAHHPIPLHGPKENIHVLA